MKIGSQTLIQSSTLPAPFLTPHSQQHPLISEETCFGLHNMLRHEFYECS